MKFSCVLAWVVYACAACCEAQTSTAGLPAANPARPTVTNPASLPPVGYLQFEQGYLGSLGSAGTATQYGFNQVTKLAVHPRLLLEVGAQPFASSTAYGGPGASHDAGGVQAGVQAVLFTPSPSQPPSPDPTTASSQMTMVPMVSVAFLHTFYGGTAPDIDLGSGTNSLVLLLSGDVGGFHYDTNYLVNEQDGDSNVSTRTIHRAQFAQTLSVNHPIFNPNLQLAVELYHFTQPLVDSTSSGQPVRRANLVDLLIAPSYQVRPNLVLDCGFSHGFTATSTQWQSFAGFTYLLPHRLWKARG